MSKSTALTVSKIANCFVNRYAYIKSVKELYNKTVSFYDSLPESIETDYTKKENRDIERCYQDEEHCKRIGNSFTTNALGMRVAVASWYKLSNKKKLVHQNMEDFKKGLGTVWSSRIS